MELKRLLTRATALLLQGAYQGAESFIEQAMAEADKLKSELAEIDTLRTRVTEMAAEVESLQSVIDEDNAQEPVCKIIRNEAGQVSIKNGEGDYFDMSKYVGFSLYARPILAQQSTENKKLTFYGNVNVAEAIAMVEQQSPAVAVPDEMKEAIQLAISLLNDDCSFGKADLLQGLLDRGYFQSPRITEQDALAIAESAGAFAGVSENAMGHFLGAWVSKKCTSLLNKLNEAKHD